MMAGVRMSNHSKERSDERSMPPFVRLGIARAAARMGDGYYNAGKYGKAVVRNGTITTVLGEKMSHPQDLPVHNVSHLFTK